MARDALVLSPCASEAGMLDIFLWRPFLKRPRSRRPSTAHSRDSPQSPLSRSSAIDHVVLTSGSGAAESQTPWILTARRRVEHAPVKCRSAPDYPAKIPAESSASPDERGDVQETLDVV